MSSNIPLARTYLWSAMQLAKRADNKTSLKYMRAALKLMFREKVKVRGPRRPHNRVTKKVKLAVKEQYRLHPHKHCAEIALAVGMGASAGGRVSEIIRGKR